MSTENHSILGKTIGVTHPPGNKIAGHRFSRTEHQKLREGKTIYAHLKTNKGYFKTAIRKSKDPTNNLLLLTFGEKRAQKAIVNPNSVRNTTQTKVGTRLKKFLAKAIHRRVYKVEEKSASQPITQQTNQYELLENAINSQDFKAILRLSKDFKFEQNAIASILNRSHLSEIQKKSIRALTSTQTRISTRSRPITNYKRSREKTNNKIIGIQINI